MGVESMRKLSGGGCGAGPLPSEKWKKNLNELIADRKNSVKNVACKRTVIGGIGGRCWRLGYSFLECFGAVGKSANEPLNPRGNKMILIDGKDCPA